MSDKEIIAQQAKQIAELQVSLQTVLRKIAALEARPAQNSGYASYLPKQLKAKQLARKKQDGAKGQ